MRDIALRQTAFSIEQMAPGGIDRGDPGSIDREDVKRARARIEQLLGRPGEHARKKTALEAMAQRAEILDDLFDAEHVHVLSYLDDAELALQPRLRTAAIEIDFTFGDKDGRVSEQDIANARRHYGEVRGPVGWNRLLLTDEIERWLFPQRALRSTSGLKLLPEDWLAGPPQPLMRLEKVALHLDDEALARTYADIAARLATVAVEDVHSNRAPIFEQALLLLGSEIRRRNSIRPTITDIARIGCEDPFVKAKLKSPIEMSRRLRPSSLLDRYLLN